jgi:PPOX class probable F420-dependent enzyme
VENPRAAALVDRYSDDWRGLWWVRLDGRARFITDGDELGRALALLRRKYEQYAETAIDNLVIAIDIDRWSSWSWRE